MKNITNNYFLSKALGIGICLFLFSGFSAVSAQDDATEEEVQVVKRPVVKKAPTYEMREVKGCIYDAATHKPMSGVRVQALNDDRYSTMTEEDGLYTLKVPVFTTVLYISTPEYNSVQLPIREGVQNVNLYSSVFNAFYKDANDIFTNKKVTLKNSSAVSVESDIENLLNGNVRTTMRGGLPAQGAYMLINGINSLNANAQPLVVVDGVIWDMQYDRTAIHDGFFNNVLASIDPEDIEDVRVVNVGTAKYGAMGANGVIEITTKRATERATRINLRVYGGIETTPKSTKVLNGNQYRNYLSSILGTYQESAKASSHMNMGGQTSLLQNIASESFLNEEKNYAYYDLYHNNTDWQDDLYKNAVTMNYKVNVQGGDDIALYALSLGYTKSNATAKENDFDRLNIRFNTDINMFNNFTSSFDIGYSKATYSIFDNGWAEDYSKSNISSPNVLGTIVPSMLSKYAHFVYWDEATQSNKLRPTTNIYSGKVYDDTPNPFRFSEDYGTSALVNPYWTLANGEGTNKNYQEQTQFSLNINPRWQVTPEFEIADRFSYSLNRMNEMYYLPINGTPTKFVEGVGSINSCVESQYSEETAIFNNFYMTYKKKFAAHSLQATGGFRLSSFKYTNNYLCGYNNSSDKMPNITSSLQYLTYGGDNSKWLNLAYYLNTSYNYKNRYYVNAGVNMESSSRFGHEASEGVKLFGVKWGLFPYVQAAWLVSSEPWFKTNRGINFLKLAASYEESGNDNIDYYASRTYFANKKFSDKATALVLENIANSQIQWETTRRFNVGVETSVLDNRVNLALNLYWSKTSNLLTLTNLSYVTGLPTMWANNGSLKNVGLDLNTNVSIINGKNFKWQAGFSIGHYKNEICSLPAGNEIKLYNLDEKGAKADVFRTIEGYTSSIYGTNNILTAVGSAAGVFYGYKTNGVFATDEEAANAGKYGYLRYPTGYQGDPYRRFKAGDVRFVDINGDGWISEADMVEIGDPNPDIYGNIFTKFNYKHWSLDVIFKYSLGNDIYNYKASQLEAGNNLWNQSAAMANRWSYSGQVTDIPRAVMTSSTEWVNNERFSDRWIEDGSFLKMKKVRLTYDLPLSLSWLQGIAVWGEANNVFSITKYTGIDPEVSCANGILYQGIDAGMLPSSRSFNLGVTINL